MAMAVGSSTSTPPLQERQVRERKRRSSNSHQYCTWAEDAVASNSASAAPLPSATAAVESSQPLPDAASSSPMVILDRHGIALEPTGSWIEVHRGSDATAEEGSAAESAEAAGAAGLQAPRAPLWLPVIGGLVRIPPEMVLLHVYDIGEEGAGAAELLRALNEMSTVNNSVFIGGIFHAGVEIYGREWAYGGNPHGSGVYESQPRSDSKHTYRATVIMGSTPLSQGEISELLERLTIQWPGNAYHMVHHNCLSFCNALCKEVGVGCVPSWIDRAPRTAAYIDNALQAAEESLQETGVPDAIDDAGALMSEAILQAVTPAFEKVVEHTALQTDALEDASLIASEVVFQAAERVRRCSVKAAGVVGDSTTRAAEVVQEQSAAAGEALCVAAGSVLDEVGLDSEALGGVQEVASEVTQQVSDGVRRRSNQLLDAWEDVLVAVGARAVIDEHVKATAKQVFDDAAMVIEEAPRVYEESTIVEDASQALQDAGQAIDDAGTAIEEAVLASVDVINETGAPAAFCSAGAYAGEVLSDAVDVVADLHPQWEKCSKEATSSVREVADAMREAAGDAVSSAAGAVRRGSKMLVGETLLVAEDAPKVFESAADVVRRVSLTVLSVIPGDESGDECCKSHSAQEVSVSHTDVGSTSPSSEDQAVILQSRSASAAEDCVQPAATDSSKVPPSADFSTSPADLHVLGAPWEIALLDEPISEHESCVEVSDGVETIADTTAKGRDGSQASDTLGETTQEKDAAVSEASPTMALLLEALPFMWPTEPEHSRIVEKKRARKRQKKRRQRQKLVDAADMALARPALSRESTSVGNELAQPLDLCADTSEDAPIPVFRGASK